MSVYVDNAQIPYGRMKMCHMIADTVDELHEMANKIGMKRKWFQNKLSMPHYDVSLTKRKLAVNAGAIEISERRLVKILHRITYKRSEL